MKLTKDQLAALRYADSDKGLDYMNAQLAAFLEGVKYARNEATKTNSSDSDKSCVNACISIFKDYCELEISTKAGSVRDAWMAGKSALTDGMPNFMESGNKYQAYPSGLQGGPQTPLDSTLDNRAGP